MVAGVKHRVIINTQMADMEGSGFNGFYRPVPSIHRIELMSYSHYDNDLEDYNYAEYAYTDFEILPRPEHSLYLYPFLTGAGYENIIRFKFYLDSSIYDGDEIWIEFTTHNELTNIFDESLGNNLGALDSM